VLHGARPIVAVTFEDMPMKKTILVLLLVGVASACSPESNMFGAGGGACAGDAPYPNHVSPVIGAFITRVYRAHGDVAERDALLAKAANSAREEAVEQARAAHAIDFLVRGYLATWVSAAGMPASSWHDLLPAGRLSPEQASVAAQQALRLVSTKRDTLGAAPWDAAWDAGVATAHAAIVDNIPGLPQGWYAASDVFSTSFQAAYVVGQAAGTTAFSAALPDIAKASAAAVNAVFVVNVATGDAVRAATNAELDTLIAM
jgi:hypothetical protein